MSAWKPRARRPADATARALHMSVWTTLPGAYKTLRVGCVCVRCHRLLDALREHVALVLHRDARGIQEGDATQVDKEARRRLRSIDAFRCLARDTILPYVEGRGPLDVLCITGASANWYSDGQHLQLGTCGSHGRFSSVECMNSFLSNAVASSVSTGMARGVALLSFDCPPSTRGLSLGSAAIPAESNRLLVPSVVSADDAALEAPISKALSQPVRSHDGDGSSARTSFRWSFSSLD